MATRYIAAEKVFVDQGSTRWYHRSVTIEAMVRRAAAHMILAGMVALGLACESDRVCAPCCDNVVIVQPDSSGDYPTIQVAIEAADSLGIIELANGRYTLGYREYIDYLGKAICIRSQSGVPESCIIDCRQSNVGFYFHMSEGLTSSLEGLTVSNASGAGVFCSGSSPTIRCCIFSQDIPRPAHAMSFRRSAARVVECVISGSWGDSGIDVWDCHGLSLSGCMIRDNFANNGGGVYCYQSSIEMEGCVLARNHAHNIGGGVSLSRTSADIQDCVFIGNRADYGGAAIAAQGGVFVWIEGCSFSGNHSKRHGGGILCREAPLYFKRTILWGNCSDDGTDEVFMETFSERDCYIEFECCLVDSQGVSGAGEDTYVGPNLFVDPLFCDPAPCHFYDGADGDYRLQPESPCLPENNPCSVLIGALPKGCD